MQGKREVFKEFEERSQEPLWHVTYGPYNFAHSAIPAKACLKQAAPGSASWSAIPQTSV
ncbi:MAG: hypothetical protein JOZ08_05710 [Verrucomicrobia bacterium]|nr:hypothetical protein [Verrucomicrobiota bacterium]